MHDLGIERDLSFVGKVGAIVLPNTQVYVGGGWSRLGLGASIPVDHVDGWKLIGGVELKLSSAMPLFLDVRYEYGMYDIKDLAPAGIDATTHSVRVGLTYQFGTMGLGSRAAAVK
jgi:opacity protein-like surface antigen